jgi:hypothetical protein
MRQWDIVAIVLSDEEIQKFKKTMNLYADHYAYLTIKPVGDYVMVRPEEIPVSTKVETLVYDPKAKDQSFKPGQLFVLEDTVQKTKKKGTKYGIGQSVSAGENCTLPVGVRMYYGKSAFYLYLEEYGYAFLRQADVYGWFD